MILLTVSAILMVLMIVVVATSKGKPADSFKKTAKPARFTRQVEQYRLNTFAFGGHTTAVDFDRTCAEYARHGYRLLQRSGRDSMDLTFERIA
jgi:hypothetical protein